MENIIGYEGKYSITKLGEVYSLGNKTHKGIHKKVQYIRKGYLSVQLWNMGKSKNILVHRILAIKFIPNPLNLPCINHKDGNKLNNDIDNLEWCTEKQNSEHASNIGLYKKVYGKDHPDSKIINQYCKKGTFIKKWWSTMDIERSLGILHGSISKCCQGKQKTAGGFTWKYIY